MRLPSVLESVLTLVFIYKIARILFKNTRSALLAGFLFAVSTYNVRLAGEMRYTNLVLLFETVSLYYFIKIIKNGTKKTIDLKSYLIFIISSFLGVISNYSFFWLFSAVFFYFIVEVLILKKEKISNIQILFTFLSFVMVPVLFLPWMPKFFSALNFTLEIVNDWISKPGLVDLYRTFMTFSVAYPTKYTIDAPPGEWGPGLIYQILSSSMLILILFKLKNSVKRNIQLIPVILIAVPLLLSFAISQFHPVFIDYNLLPVLIGIILHISNLLKNKLYNFSLIILYLILNVSSFRVLMKYEVNKEDWKQLYYYLTDKKLEFPSLVMIYPAFNQTVLDYYALSSDIKPTFELIGLENNAASENNNFNKLDSGFYNNICLLSYTHDDILGLMQDLRSGYRLESVKIFPKSNIVSCYQKI